MKPGLYTTERKVYFFTINYVEDHKVYYTMMASIDSHVNGKSGGTSLEWCQANAIEATEEDLVEFKARLV